MRIPSVAKKELIRPVLIELGWLAGALLGALLLDYFLVNVDIRSGTADVQLYDTYFVFSAAKSVAATWLVLIFAVYLIRTLRQRFSQAIPAVLLPIAGLALLVLITLINKYLLTEVMPVSYVVYPMIDTVSSVPPGSEAMANLIATTINALAVSQLVIVVTLLYAAFQWGRNTK